MYILPLMSKIRIISSFTSPRLIYTCDLIFRNYFSSDFEIVTVKEPTAINGPAITYGNGSSTRGGLINIPAGGLLSETGVREISWKCATHEDLPYLFENEYPGADLPFDLFGFVFFMITRYEEYHPTGRDRYGRFLATQSSAWQHGFLQIPIVDLWIDKLGKLINRSFGTDLKFKGAFSVLPTIDIDQPLAYKGKGLRNIFGFFRDLSLLRFPNLKDRVGYLLYGKDPFDTFDYIRQMFRESDLTPVIFVLNQFNPPLDLNHIYDTTEWIELLNELKDWAEIGAHPSLYARDSLKSIELEITSLSKSTGRSITKSRQHYLRINIPHIYAKLSQLGIKDDFSMGYPDQIGFRAGVARSFYWYDLHLECATELRIHPCPLMDVTLRYYMNLSPDTAIKKCQDIFQSIKDVKGQMVFIWHNSNLSSANGWHSWRKVFEKLVNMGKTSSLETGARKS